MMQTPRWDDLAEGMELTPLVKPVMTTRQLVMYAGASGDFYEVHYDTAFAQSTGLQQVIVHGLLKTAFVGQLVTSWLGEGEIRKLAVQYRGMDVPGDVITVGGKITKRYEQDGDRLVDLDVWTENSRGERTTPGKVTVALPA